MGRRSTAQLQSRAESLHGRLSQELAALNITVNRVQFRAQLYEEEMVDLVRDMALSTEATMPHRLECARQIVLWSRGKVDEWRHDKETLRPEDTTITGGLIGDTIEQARQTANLFARLDDLVRRKVPVSDWPSDIRQMAEAQPFVELEDDDRLISISLTARVESDGSGEADGDAESEDPGQEDLNPDLPGLAC